MKWLRRLTVLLSGLLLGCALLLAGAVLFLQEADYKRLLIWGAERFLDSQLAIEGPVSVDFSKTLSLTSGDIFLKANDDSYRLSVGTFNASFRLGSYLQTGTVWFNSLELSDVNLEVTETPGDDFILEKLYIPPVVIGEAQVNNLVLTYQELHPGTLHTLSLAELSLGELGEHQPVSWRATGLFEGQPFVLQGTASPLAQLVEGRGPQALQLELSSAPVNAQLQGTIADPLNGLGLDLWVQFDIPQVGDIIEILEDDIPQLGNLQGSLSVRGDYAAPQLEAIDLHLQRDTEVDLVIRGSVADALTGAGLNLQLDGQSSNPEVLSWLLFRKHDRMQRVQISGRLKKDATRFSLHDLDASAETADGLKLQFSGSAIVHPAGHRLTPADACLTVQFSARTLAAANLIRLADIPELGPVSGSLALALGMDAVGIYNADFDIGSLRNSRILLKGDVGYVQLTEKPELSGLKLQTDINTTEIAQLGKQLGFELPELGPARLRGTLLSQGPELVLQDARLRVGAADQPSIRANGRMTTQFQKGSTINVALDLAVTELITAFSGKLPGYLGHLEGNAQISNLDGQWGIESFSLASSQTSLYQLELSGSYDDLVNHDEASINTSLVIDNLEKLGETHDLNLTGMGAYRMQGLLTVDKGRLRYEGKTTLGSTSSTTEISGYLQDGKPVLNGSIEIPVLLLADFGMGSSGRHIPAKASGKVADRPHVFSRDELNIEFLNDVDLDLALSIDEVENGGRVIDSVKGRLQLHNGQLSIEPLSLVFEGGNTDIKLDLLATAIPEYRLEIISDDVSLGPLMAQIQGQVPIHGYSNMHLDLHTQGRSPHEMASGLSGSVSLALENAQIPRNYVELLSVDVFGWVLSKTVSRDQYLDLNCLVMAFAIKAGEVKSETIKADGPGLSLGGQINMDLGVETLDIVLIPKQKKRAFSSISPVKVVGPMQSPEIKAIPAKAALKEISTMALLPGVFVPIRAAEKLWSLLDDGDKVGGGCAKSK